MAVDVTNHTVLIIRRGHPVKGTVTDVVGRPGHLDLDEAKAVAAAGGGVLVAMRHNRRRDGKAARTELVRVEALDAAG